MASGTKNARIHEVKLFEARVVGGRLILNAPSALPEGTIVPLMIADPDDGELDEEERSKLKASLKRARADFRAGRVHTAAQVIKGRRRVAR